jgi:hypothetical protein
MNMSLLYSRYRPALSNRWAAEAITAAVVNGVYGAADRSAPDENPGPPGGYSP